MSEEEANRLRASNQLLDSNNRILAQRLKDKDKAKNKESKVVMSKVELYKFCIKLLKLIKREMED